MRIEDASASQVDDVEIADPPEDPVATVPAFRAVELVALAQMNVSSG
jgi:hypothetical protein